MITVVIRTTAGISNPTESKSYKAQVEFGDNDFEDVAGLFVPRVVGLDEEDGGRGDKITVTGKGYKNGTTVTFWRDEMTRVMWNEDGSSTDNDDKVWLLLRTRKNTKPRSRLRRSAAPTPCRCRIPTIRYCGTTMG